MRVLIGIAHPKQVHLFRYFSREMERRGHAVHFLAVHKDITRYLLDCYHLPYTSLGEIPPGLAGKAAATLGYEYRTWQCARRFRADLFISRALPHFAHVSRLLRKPYLLIEDTEHSWMLHAICFPFADAIITPDSYRDDLGKRHVRFPGFSELAYLHPRYFTPDPSVLGMIGVAPGERFTVLRFVSRHASHDVGHASLRMDIKRRVVLECARHGRVFISSEQPLPAEFEEYRITIPPEKMHDLLAFATLLYGDSATMASECAMLGTHAVFCDFAGRGYTSREEEQYQLVYNFPVDPQGQQRSIEKTRELLLHDRLKEEGREKRTRLLADSIDLTEFLVQFVEHYPEKPA